LKARPEAVVSYHPMACLAGIGKDAEAILQDHWKQPTAHGHGTPYMRIAEMDGYVCLLGVDQDRNTTLHTVEALLELPYLTTTEEKIFPTPEGEVTKSWDFFPGPHRDFIGLDRLLRESGKMRIGRVGNAVTRLIRSRELIDLCLAAGRRDPAFVLCDNPACADCVGQRAAIWRHRFAAESFSVAAAASLAGRYIPEMIENLKAAGIDAVELDCVEGMPVQAMPRDRLAGAVRELKQAGIDVTGLRLSALPADIGTLLDTAAAAEVFRLVLPISGEAAAQTQAAKKKNVTLSFYNLGISSLRAAEILLELKECGLDAGFTFNAANFAAAGEKPFLESYKQKLRRFVDQLDVEDATFDGTPQPLGLGNAEIKEMISILRCASFDGRLVFSARNRSSVSLRAEVERLLQLLDAM
jgi:sugar phosphate isomerase/epimerase